MDKPTAGQTLDLTTEKASWNPTDRELTFRSVSQEHPDIVFAEDDAHRLVSFLNEQIRMPVGAGRKTG